MIQHTIYSEKLIAIFKDVPYLKLNSREDFLLCLAGFLPQSPRVAELGVYKGDFSEMILRILSPSHLLLVDPFKTGEEKYEDGVPLAYSSEKEHRFVSKRFSGNKVVEIIPQLSTEAVKDIVDHSLDMVYIDACHKYDCVKTDLEDWMPKLKPGGIISGHDYFKHEDFGVIEAVNEFMNEYKFRMIAFNKNGNDFALKKK